MVATYPVDPAPARAPPPAPFRGGGRGGYRVQEVRVRCL